MRIKKKSPSSNRNTTSKRSFFYYLDCNSGEGLINPLLIQLKKTPNLKFESHLGFILEECINVNRSFSDAIEFLSIWLEKSPDSLLEKLKNAEIKRFFNRTEYGQEGDQWYFPKLLEVFLTLVEKKQITANEILNYLFATFDFFNLHETFITEIIGYDRLELCIKESPVVFKQALLSKVYEFAERNKSIDVGSRSRKYLNDEIQAMDGIKKIKTKKQTDRQELISYILEGGFFRYSCIKKDFNSDDRILSHQPFCFKR